jgi:hypothetical protein
MNVGMPFDLRDSVLVDEPSLFVFYGFSASSADDGLRFSEEHVGLTES